ncbi:hypothetical protein sce9349 [Sorangium cellulosum So ce56]|uniref:Disintegrin domain-containing protein n=2 Tax=Sorangium cellulosum TaxID=56 RepID=A9GHN5_SORC5|nr:hypothetical protein sce9349 [Sorangium cellulosum So ce56]
MVMRGSGWGASSGGARRRVGRGPSMPAGLALFALWVLATIASCADLLGVDTESEHNPCNDPNADELPPVSCHEGRGICWVLLDACDDLGLPATCPPLEPKPSDTCNDNFDNDCDGAIDEDDCACQNGAEKLCYPASQDTLGQGRGLCREGTQPCQNGVWGQCAGAIVPTSELCDQLDNDCDGEVDEGCPCNDGDEQFCYRGPEDTLGHDPCNYGRQHCNEGRWGECKDDVLPSLERCDNLDNDCDGVTDDLPGVGLPCETGLSARCSAGTTQCDAEDGSIRCLPKATSDAEQCNGEDDNCDGQVDDGPFCCPDNTLNGNESDIDCGGSCLEKCEVGEMCRDDVDCKTSICAGTRCQPKKGLGEPCDADVKCESTHCVDGVCCDAECSALCYACTTSLRGIGQDGVCGPIASDRDPDEECNSQAPATCGNTGFCNGAGACQQHPATTACREATCSADGITLELADTCNGSGSCVDRGNQSCAPFSCRGDACTDQLRAGEPCTSASECADGYCVDGVCCQTACGNGSPGDCQACNVAGHLGTCSPSPAGAICRGATDVCDVAELCDGASTVCPADGVRDAGVVCRSSTGDCDVAEACNGLTKACPVEAFKPSGTVCRGAAGDCDLPETCTGTGAVCPDDVFRSSTTVCRASAGGCDVPEMCSGLSPVCPGDTRLPSGTVCREAEGECDIAETCSGTSAVCPSDQRRPSGTVCREAGPGGCDVEERCNGTSPACPGDAVRPSGAVCRASAGACDIAEACDGSSAVCPGDAVRVSGTVCRASAGGCDVAETCDGAGAACPVDARAPSGTVCRAAAGGCDVAEICDGSGIVCPADAMRAGGTVCRAVAGDCDVAETCDGATAACPSDVVRPTGTTCRVVAGGCDVAETCDGATAVCPVDAVRATGAVCRVAAGDCDVAETCDGATAGCPSDARVPGGTVCRAAAGDCDVAETCNGTAAGCPSDARVPGGTVCRASAGDCDVAETCNGTAAACPSDAMRASGTVCRAAAGDCDVAETCNGSTAACPSDAIRESGTVCRASAGDCDVAETCNGSTAACPSDARMPGGTVCRAAAGDCDVVETCNGTAAACPIDARVPGGTVCRASAGDCDVAETCNGTAPACPSDAMRANGTVCRGVAGDCDVAESCDGATAACPIDAIMESGTVCRASAGDCDVAETCNGSTAACPIDARVPGGTVCRASAGDCDVAESCDGATAACPSDAMRASGTVCRAAAGDCDVAETCNGSTAVCPSDAMRASGTVCRASAGDCDVAETCNGSTAACPSDAMRESGTVCRAVAGDCDVAESCDGATAACPSDAMKESGTECRAAAGGCDMAESCTGDSADCPANTAPCGLYACAGSQCLTSCDADTDCVAGAFCTGNIMIPGTCQAHTVLLLGGADDILGAHFHPGEDWQTATITGAGTADRVAVALNLEGGMGLVRGSSGTSSGKLRYALWDYTSWTSFDALGGTDVNVLGWPALSSGARSIHAAFLVDTGMGRRDAYRGFAGNAWQPFGYVEDTARSDLAPDIAALPSDRPAMVYTHGIRVSGSDVLEIRARERNAENAWVLEPVLSTNVSGGTPSSIVPSSTVPSSTIAFRGGSGADLLVVLVDSAGGMYWRRRTGTTTWSPLLRIGTLTTSHQVALAALDGGLAVMAYRSNSGTLYTRFFNPSGSGSWSTATQPVSNIRIVGSPALARGVGAGTSAAASVELAYVLDSTSGGTGTSGALRHTRCTAMTSGACSSWTSAVGVGAGTGFSSVAIASMP